MTADKIAALEAALIDYEALIDKMHNTDSADTVGEWQEQMQKVAYKHRKCRAHLEQLKAGDV